MSFRKQIDRGYKGNRKTLAQKREEYKQKLLREFDPPLTWFEGSDWPCCPIGSLEGPRRA